MIEEMGVVKKVEGEFVWVETQVKTTCGSCQAKSNCGTSVIAKVFNPKAELLRLKSPINLKVGQQVKLGIPEETLVSASALVYLLPLSVFMLTIFSTQSAFALHELFSLFFGLFGALISFWWVSRYSKTQQTSSFSPIIMGAINQSEIVLKHEIPSKKLS
ncbi:SoxR reducing system RseC family protein [Glaciecola sp. KUL10]|uniref:SoxR reducing system RseC family protein n=1 Tax=Glaciecola sp. (strain KUL10) TaxID=2161813 RepID=UPI000D789387|nr:SoxR reducing system RseC family protein [Glaciecola sp. KUL10]GBL04690.1 positive regulator of sigma E, RseC/MucC [Glaciecola sp. KUL10]